MKSFNLFGDSWSDDTEKKQTKTVEKKSVKKGTKSSRSKSENAYRTISEVAEDMGIATHVLRFWETKFPDVQPLRRGGGRRYYRPEDIVILKNIQHLLHEEGYTIKGVQSIIKRDGFKVLKNIDAFKGQGDATAESANPTQDSSRILQELKEIRTLLEV